MTTELKDYRLDGIYRQRQEGFLMQRVKLAAGSLSSLQARTVSLAAQRFGRGAIHLTTRGSMEIHWLREADLGELKRTLASAGLTSRGACGGAVRGVTCGSSQALAEFPPLENLARRLQRHFTGNPRFERLPKKFKIGIEATTTGNRHLIQDVGLVATFGAGGVSAYDMYVAGGLGREPQAGFLLESRLPDERVIPLIESVLRVYAAGAPAGKRLKHLLASIGEEEFRRRLAQDPAAGESLPPFDGFPEGLSTSPASPRQHLQACTFAGEMASATLAGLADFADAWTGGLLLVTADQNIALPLLPGSDREAAAAALAGLGYGGTTLEEQVTFRVCPGTHECRAGLSATRDVARALLPALPLPSRQRCWALSGCHNSCTQPQLADLGIVTSRLVADEQGQRTPRFDLYRGESQGLGQKVESGLTLEQLLAAVARLA